MNQIVTVRGRYADKTFIPDGPLPVVEGEAKLVITPAALPASPKRGSIADLIGQGRPTMSGEEIAEQLRLDRDGQ